MDKIGPTPARRESRLVDIYRSVPALKRPLSSKEIDEIIQDERAAEYRRRNSGKTK